MMKLYVFNITANSQGLVALIKKVGVEDQIEYIDSLGKTRTEEFIKMNPCHTCPTLQLEDGTVIWESNALLRYFATTTGDLGDMYYPRNDPILCAKIDMVMDWRQCSWYNRLRVIGYIAFGMKLGGDEDARNDFKALQEECFPVLVDTFLKDKKFIFSDTPTIADLSVAPTIRLLAARSKFWAKVPQEIKDYEARFYEAFPENKAQFDVISDMMVNTTFEGYDLEP